MDLKKSCSFIAFLTLLVSSCSSHGIHHLVRDIDSYLTDSLFQEFSIQAIEKEMTINNEFVVYLGSTGCSACDSFQPEFESFLKGRHYLTYRFDAKDNSELADQIITTYPDIFAKKDEASGGYYLSYPSVFIVKGREATEIPYGKLKNTTMISNAFNVLVHDCNVYFSQGDIVSRMVTNYDKLPFNTFGYLAFDFSNESLLTYFKNTIQDYINYLSFPVIVTDFEETEGVIAVKKKHITTDGKSGSSAETVTSDESNFEYVKTVLNK